MQRLKASGLWVIALSTLAAVGCGPGGSGGTGDPPTDPKADPYGTGARIHEVLGPATWLDASDEESLSCPDVPPDRDMLVSGVVVVGKDTYDETGAGATGNYYIQDVSDPVVEYSGLTLFAPGFSPPDLRVVQGDVLDIFGALTEFIGPSVGKFGYCRTLPEISGSVQFRFEGSSVPAVKIDASELGKYETARKWMGMLVEVDNLELTEPPYDPGTGRYSIRFDGGPIDDTEEIPTLTNELMDLKTSHPDLMDGQVISNVKGIVTYFYGVHLAPRSPDDITL